MDKELVIRGIIISSGLEDKKKNELLTYFNDLIENDIFLTCLRNAGVDNWEGYSDVQELYNQDIEEEYGE